MNHLEARYEELLDEVATKQLNREPISKQRMDEIEAEAAEIQTQIRTRKKGQSMASWASPADYGHTDTNPGDYDAPAAFKGFAPGMENRIRPVSMYEIDKTQIGALQKAAIQGTPFRVQIGQKGIEHGQYGVHTKAAVTEGGLAPNALPPIQQPGPGGWWGLPYELTRVANFIPNVAMPAGGGLAYFRHDSNGAEAAYTAEGALKPDLTPVISEQYIKAAKVAGRVNLTHEIVMDAGDTFASHIVNDLARSVYNAESALLLSGTKAANGFDGINSVSGSLTQPLGTDSALDCLSKAFVALRNDYFPPDLVFVHPSTLGAIRRLKDTQGRYVLNLIEGAGSITGSEQETLWGVTCVQTTQQAAGTAAVLSVQSGAAIVYVRESLTTSFDPYSQIANNIYQYVAETRLALAVPRPSAICLCTGLPTS